jgi:predicted ATPase
VGEAEPHALLADLGSGAADIARIVPELGERLGIELRPVGDGRPIAGGCWKRCARFSVRRRNGQPIALVLEDVHDADRGTLDLLLHLARNLSGCRLLVVASYRDVEVDRAHPLSAALTEAAQVQPFHACALHGLTIDEVHRLYCLVRGQDVPLSRSEAVHRRTEGNPLFVQEVLRYTLEAGIVVRRGERYVRADDGSPEGGIPEGLRDVVGKRLSRLSANCNRLLSIAAVIGRDIDMRSSRSWPTWRRRVSSVRWKKRSEPGCCRNRPGQGHLQPERARATEPPS